MVFKITRIALFGAIILGAPPALAEDLPGGFTFKRVSPPTAGAKRLISIHVEPIVKEKAVLDHIVEMPDEKKERPKPAPLYAESDDWFWANVSPDMKDAGFGKLALASAVLLATPDKAHGLAPSTQQLRRIIDSFGSEILKATAGTQVSPALVVAIISTESAGREAAVSSAGASGLMQLMPATAKRFGVKKIADPGENISGGVQYLDFLLDHFGGDAVLAIAAYNAGEGAVRRNGGVPDYKETRGYVPKVVAAWDLVRGMCMIPPVKATDGCIFTGMRVATQ